MRISDWSSDVCSSDLPAASGWRAMASIAAATARPSASAGPIEPLDTASTAPMMLNSLGSMDRSPLACLDAAGGGAAKAGCEYGEDVGLPEAEHDLERHQRDRHEQPGQRDHQRADDTLGRTPCRERRCQEEKK